jgi:hypothetical protein
VAENQPQSLPELAYDDATGDTRAIYDALASALGVRLVNLVYRHLATVPGCLEWAWSTVGADFLAGRFADRAPALAALAIRDVDAAPAPISLASCGLGNREAEAAIRTVDAYNRANPMNALSLRVVARALAAGRPAGPYVRPDSDASALVPLLPISPLDGLPRPTSELLLLLARQAAGPETRIVPSLFRHFAPWPPLLAAISARLAPLASSGGIDAAAARITAEAERRGDGMFEALPPPGAGAELPPEEARAVLAGTVAAFPPAICRMIAVGAMLRTVLRP